MENKIIPSAAHANKIIIWGQSCVGKTAFAFNLLDHKYYCFDSFFCWSLVETFPLSIASNFERMVDSLTADRYVLDGWHLADQIGAYLPPDSTVYLVYANYPTILAQTKTEVNGAGEYYQMFRRWYLEPDYESLPVPVRFFFNNGNLIETSFDEFRTWAKSYYN